MFGFPISLFFGIGIFVVTDIIQPSYFKNMPVYYPYFLGALFVGYLSVFIASGYIANTPSKIKGYVFALVYMLVEAMFSLFAVKTYYGSENVPLLRQIAALSLPLVFSLFYFLGLIEHEKKGTHKRYENELLKKFDDLESSKPDIGGM